MNDITYKHFQSNDTLAGLFQVKRDVIYSTGMGRNLTLDLISPWAAEYADEKPALPLVVFVQGSGWLTPDPNFELPQLCEFARRGYVVASVRHRDCIADGTPAPAFLVDVKCAIRFLREHAAEYGIDPGRVGIWGTSSGAHTAQLVGVTAGISEFESPEHADFSDAVEAVVSCFGPSNLVRWLECMGETPDFAPLHDHFVVGTDEERVAMAEKLSAIRYVDAERASDIPPFLLGVGTDDPYVETTQVTNMVEALEGIGVEAEGFLVDGAHHESNFWSKVVLDEIWAFLDRRLRN